MQQNNRSCPLQQWLGTRFFSRMAFNFPGGHSRQLLGVCPAHAHGYSWSKLPVSNTTSWELCGICKMNTQATLGQAAYHLHKLDSVALGGHPGWLAWGDTRPGTPFLVKWWYAELFAAPPYISLPITSMLPSSIALIRRLCTCCGGPHLHWSLDGEGPSVSDLSVWLHWHCAYKCGPEECVCFVIRHCLHPHPVVANLQQLLHFPALSYWNHHRQMHWNFLD